MPLTYPELSRNAVLVIHNLKLLFYEKQMPAYAGMTIQNGKRTQDNHSGPVCETDSETATARAELARKTQAVPVADTRKF